MKPKIGIIGCGYWGKNLVSNFHQLGVLNAICDLNPACLQEHLLRYEGIRGFDDPQKMFSDSEISAVVISSPAETHYRLAKKALLAGKDVFVEKPLALKAKEGEDLVALAERNKRILMVGHVLEYHLAILKLKEWVKSGQLGQIHYIYSNRLNLGKVRREENIKAHARRCHNQNPFPDYEGTETTNQFPNRALKMAGVHSGDATLVGRT